MNIKKNTNYIILEKPNSVIPELKRNGKYKLGVFDTVVPIKYNDLQNRYDTGLNRHSEEFKGMSETEISKNLEERKELINYLNSLVEGSGKSETEFLSTYLHKFKINHNKILDTSDLDTWLKLWLATRLDYICPEKNKGNVKYKSSPYMLRDSGEKLDAEKTFKDKQNKAMKWFYKTYSEDKEKVENILRYENILPAGQKKDESLLMDLLKVHINKIDKLDNLLRTIESTPYQTIILHNEVIKAVKNRKITRHSGRFFYLDTELGSDTKAVIKFLDNPDNFEITEKILN